MFVIFCFFNDTATTEIYTYCHTLSLHDALPIYVDGEIAVAAEELAGAVERIDQPERAGPERRQAAARRLFLGDHRNIGGQRAQAGEDQDRKSTRLNSSH